MKRTIRVGSRTSKLAMVQTHWVIEKISEKHPELAFEIIGINTTGDVILDRPLDKIGGKGLFIKELEQALYDGTIDFAVHSMKDMPAVIPAGLEISAVSIREDPRDVLVTFEDRLPELLPKDAVIGTGSIRREVQLAAARPGYCFKPLRGNVLTRLDKLERKEYDAIMLAAAGLRRLGLEHRCKYYIDPSEVIPAVGQGALAIESSVDFEKSFLLDSIHHQDTFWAVSAERAFMIALNGDCSTPIAAFAEIDGEGLKLSGMLAKPDKSCICRAAVEGGKQDAVQLGKELAAVIRKQMNV